MDCIPCLLFLLWCMWQWNITQVKPNSPTLPFSVGTWWCSELGPSLEATTWFAMRALKSMASQTPSLWRWLHTPLGPWSEACRWADQELDFVGFSWIYSCFVPLLTLFLLSHLRIRTRIAWSFLMPGTLFKQEGADSKGWHERVPCFWQQTPTFRKAKTCKIRAGLVTHTHTKEIDAICIYIARPAFSGRAPKNEDYWWLVLLLLFTGVV